MADPGTRTKAKKAGKTTKRAAASKRRQPLSTERIVAQALSIADAQGTEALSMRTLAEALGVQAMSLYHHVANKDVLLDRMVDAVFAAAGLPPEVTGPDVVARDVLRARAVILRDVLHRHPWAVGLLESRRNPGATTLAHHDRTIGLVRQAGWSVVMIAHALALLDAYVYGFVVQERSLPLEPAEDMSELAAHVLALQPEGTLPHLAWFTAEHVLQPGYDFAAEFLWGLDLLLDGLVARAEVAPRGAPATYPMRAATSPPCPRSPS